MSVTLKVTPQQLRQTAQEFQTQGQQIRNLTNQMLSIVNSLTGPWEGEAQRTYCKQFKALDGDMAQLYLKIVEHVQKLTEIAANYDTAENKNTSTAGALSTDWVSD